MLPRTLFRHAQRKLSTSAWEVSLETTISDNEKDIFFHLIPIPKEQVPLLPTGTVAIRPVGRPSSYELCMLNFSYIFIFLLSLVKMDSDKKIAALSAEFAELKTELSEVKGQLKAQDTRIIVIQV